MLVVISIIAMLIAFLLPALTSARTSARTAHCMNNLRQIGIAVHGYAYDNRDAIPHPKAHFFTAAGHGSDAPDASWERRNGWPERLVAGGHIDAPFRADWVKWNTSDWAHTGGEGGVFHCPNASNNIGGNSVWSRGYGLGGNMGTFTKSSWWYWTSIVGEEDLLGNSIEDVPGNRIMVADGHTIEHMVLSWATYTGSDVGKATQHRHGTRSNRDMYGNSPDDSGYVNHGGYTAANYLMAGGQVETNTEYATTAEVNDFNGPWSYPHLSSSQTGWHVHHWWGSNYWAWNQDPRHWEPHYTEPAWQP